MFDLEIAKNGRKTCNIDSFLSFLCFDVPPNFKMGNIDDVYWQYKSFLRLFYIVQTILTILLFVINI